MRGRTSMSCIPSSRLAQVYATIQSIISLVHQLLAPLPHHATPHDVHSVGVLENKHEYNGLPTLPTRKRPVKARLSESSLRLILLRVPQARRAENVLVTKRASKRRWSHALGQTDAYVGEMHAGEMESPRQAPCSPRVNALWERFCARRNAMAKVCESHILMFTDGDLASVCRIGKPSANLIQCLCEET